MLVDRGYDYHAVLAEGLAAEVAVLAAHADKAKVEQDQLMTAAFGTRPKRRLN